MSVEPMINPTVRVREVMKTSVVTVNEGEPIVKVAKLMATHNIGSVVVTNRKGDPVGIITERDLVARVLAQQKAYNKIKASQIMSSPLHAIHPDVSLEEAARKMNKHGIRRLVVVESDKLLGVVTSRDILALTPALAEIIQEKAKLGLTRKTAKPKPLAGYCDECGQWSDILKESHGKLLCEECLAELATEEA